MADKSFCREMCKALTESVVDAHGPCHTLFTLDSREHFSRVLECYWSFSERIADREKVHKQHDRTDLGSARARIV